MNIFDRVKTRLQCGKDFPPEMVKELVEAYESRLAEISGKLTPLALDTARRPITKRHFVNKLWLALLCGINRRASKANR